MFIARRVLGTLIMAALIGIPVSAYAAELTVVTGPDTSCGDGTCDFPSALSYAATNGEGDTLTLPGVTFNTTATYSYASTENYPLSIVGQGPDQTELSGSFVQVLSISALADTLADISISGLAIRNGVSGNSDGGGLWVNTRKGDVTIDGCAFTGNNAGTGRGGGAYIAVEEFGTGQASVSNSYFFANQAASGGGLTIEFPVVSLAGNTLDFNFAKDSASGRGGGAEIVLIGGPGTVTDNTFTRNNGLDDARGGGLYLSGVLSSPVTLSGNRFEINGLGNSGLGGGAYLYAVDNSFKIINNTFIRNTMATTVPGSGGGGMAVETVGSGGSITLASNAFTENSASLAGGALITAEMGVVTFTNNTVGGNGIDTGSQFEVMTADLYNNIFWGNTGDDLELLDYMGSGATVDLYNNVIGALTQAAGVDTGSNGQNTDQDPSLSSDYLHLLSSSAAVDAGDGSAPGLTALGTPAKDVDGQARVQGAAIDIGADELVAASAPLLDVDPLSHNFGTVSVAGTTNPVTITVSNLGSIALTVTGVSMADTVNFSLDLGAGSSPCGSAPFGIGSGGSCTLAAAFSPSGAQAYSTDLTVASTDTATGPLTVQLSGDGLATEGPDISVDPAAVSINRLVSAGYETLDILAISNVGSALLTVNSVSISDTVNFSVDLEPPTTPCGATPFAIDAGGYCWVEVVFQPADNDTAAGYSTILEIDSNDPDTPLLQVDVSGEVVETTNAGGGGCSCNTADPVWSGSNGLKILWIVLLGGLLFWYRKRIRQ